MREVTLETTVGSGDLEVTYAVVGQNWDTPEEYYEALRGVKPDITQEQCEKALMDVVNSQQNQGLMQTKKAPVRDALKETGDPESDKVEEAIAAHKEWAPTYVISGGSRGRIAGVTKTKAGEVGKALLEADPDQLKELAESLGINLG